MEYSRSMQSAAGGQVRRGKLSSLATLAAAAIVAVLGFAILRLVWLWVIGGAAVTLALTWAMYSGLRRMCESSVRITPVIQGRALPQIEASYAKVPEITTIKAEPRLALPRYQAQAPRRDREHAG